eukprot:2688387-Prymnesium_polylepis.1
MRIWSRGRVAWARNATFVKVPPQMTGSLRAPPTLFAPVKNKIKIGFFGREGGLAKEGRFKTLVVVKCTTRLKDTVRLRSCWPAKQKHCPSAAVKR